MTTTADEIDRLARLMHEKFREWYALPENHRLYKEGRGVNGATQPFDEVTPGLRAAYRAVAAAVLDELAAPSVVVERKHP